MAGGLGVFRQYSSRVTLAGGNKMITRQSQSLTQVWVVTEPADRGHWDEMLLSRAIFGISVRQFPSL